jgi:hypothetical protein
LRGFGFEEGKKDGDGSTVTDGLERKEKETTIRA